MFLILGIAGMHASFGTPVMPDHVAVSMPGNGQTVTVHDVASVSRTATMPSDSTSEIVQDIMHACVFLITVAVLALLAAPAFRIWGPRLLPRLLAPARRRLREPGGLDRLLALGVLRI